MATRSASMVGRETQLAVLTELARQAGAHRPSVVAVLGEAGIGKTRLVDELVGQLQSDRVLVACGQCAPGAVRDIPLAPVRAVVQDIAEALGARLHRLSPSGEKAVTTLLSETVADRQRSAGSQAELFESLAHLVRDVASAQLLVVVIEDVQWADRTSRELVEFLARSLRDEQLVLVLTARTRDPDYASCQPLIADLSGLRTGHRLELGRLTVIQVRDQLIGLRGGTVPDPSVLAQVVAVTEGVPLFVEELLDAELDDVGPLADVLVGHRVTRLAPAARLVTDTAAVAVLAPTPQQLAQACPLPADEFDEAFADAVNGGVLVRDHGLVVFRHALLREATLARIPPNAESAAHRAWSKVIGPEPTGQAATVAAAHHRREAGDEPGALEAYVTAARTARGMSAYTEETELLKLAAQLWSVVPDAEERTGTTLSELYADAASSAHQAMVDLAEAQRLVKLAISALPADATVHRRAMLRLLWHRLRWADDKGLTTREVLDVVADVAMDPPSRDAVNACLEAAAALLQSGEPDRSQEYARRAVSLSDAIDDSVLQARARAALAMAHARRLDFAEAVPLADRAVVLAERSGDLFAQVDTLAGQELILWLAGDMTPMASASARLVALLGGDRPGPLRGRWAMAQTNLAEGLIDAGRWSEAQSRLDLVLAEDLPDHIFWCARRLLEHLSVWRGDALPPRTEDFPAAPQRDTLDDVRLDDLLAAHYTYVDIAARLGDLTGARADALALLGEDRVVANTGYLLPFLLVAARVESDLATSGSNPAPDEGSWVAERIRHLLGQVGPPRNDRDRAYAAHVCAELERRAGTATSDTWDAVITAWRSTTTPFPLAAALVRAGDAHRAAGRVRQAASALREAAQICKELGARPLLEEAMAIARSAHLRLANDLPRPASDLGLTARELDVLRLVAEGASNPAIARQLFISPKTASVHVSNILAKLEVSSRGEAAAVAHRTGIVEPTAAQNNPR